MPDILEIEARLASLERSVAELQAAKAAEKPPAWWEHAVGAFADDPEFEDVVRLGREYRASVRDPEPGP